MSRIAIGAGQAYTPPFIRQAIKGCIEVRASQLFVHNMIFYGINALQMIEWALPCKQFLGTELSVVTAKVDKQLSTSVVIPKAQTSPVMDILNLSASKYSGAIQSKVPSRSPLMTRPSDASVIREEPKSVRSACPSLETKTLACHGRSVESIIWLKVEYTHAFDASVNNRTLCISVEVMQSVCDSQDLNNRVRWAANARLS